MLDSPRREGAGRASRAQRIPMASENVQAKHIATMYDDTVYRRTNARMFRSDFFEFFSKVHPAVPAILFLPVFAWALRQSVGQLAWWQIVAGVAGGVAFWSFTEYTLHRFYFHIPPTNAVTRWMYFYSHGIHHAYPDDYYRLVMVPAVSIPLAFLFYALFRAALPAEWVGAAFAGMVLGYLNYDYVHFATHHVKPPRSALLAPIAAIMKAQRKRHMKHHFDDHDTGYGVSTAFWDYVFFTVAKDGPVRKGALPALGGRGDGLTGPRATGRSGDEGRPSPEAATAPAARSGESASLETEQSV
jgi:sterol desaturase/sphingolipid hydroxylase (fatty acid hydroxylase superfamily)